MRLKKGLTLLILTVFIGTLSAFVVPKLVFASNGDITVYDGTSGAVYESTTGLYGVNMAKKDKPPKPPNPPGPPVDPGPPNPPDPPNPPSPPVDPGPTYPTYSFPNDSSWGDCYSDW